MSDMVKRLALKRAPNGRCQESWAIEARWWMNAIADELYAGAFDESGGAISILRREANRDTKET